MWKFSLAVLTIAAALLSGCASQPAKPLPLSPVEFSAIVPK